MEPASRKRLGSTTFIIGKMGIAKLDTHNGRYYFPLSMKEKGHKYPEWNRCSLVNQDGEILKEISPENCPLYIEIQKHLVNK